MTKKQTTGSRRRNSTTDAGDAGAAVEVVQDGKYAGMTPAEVERVQAYERETRLYAGRCVTCGLNQPYGTGEECRDCLLAAGADLADVDTEEV